MWILPLLGLLGMLLGFAFLTLAIASGLYYLSELVEEHTVLAKKLLYQLIYGVIGLQLLLLVVDHFPAGLSALSIVSHVIYAQNLRSFPVVKLTNPLFILSCALVIANHYLWYLHFSAFQPTFMYNAYARKPHIPNFTEVASYFGLCIWLVPFALFVSLSAGENVLPSINTTNTSRETGNYVMSSQPSTTLGNNYDIGVATGSPLDGKRRSRGATNAGMAKAVVTGVKEWVAESGEVMGFWGGDRTRRTF